MQRNVHVHLSILGPKKEFVHQLDLKFETDQVNFYKHCLSTTDNKLET